MNIGIIDIFGRAILFTLHAPFLVPFLLIGYFSRYRPIFTRCIFILLFTLILNPYLKSLWQVPLMPHLGEGYAFPSGHMQVAVVLWGWLAFEFRRMELSILAFLLIIGTGYSLIHFNYHNSFDIIGGLMFGVLTLMIYYGLNVLFKHKNAGYIGCVLFVLSIIIMMISSAITMGMWTYTGILLLFSMLSLPYIKKTLSRQL